MTIPNVTPGTVINSSQWGNEVADSINQRNLVCILSRTISVPNTGSLSVPFTDAHEESDPGGWHDGTVNSQRVTPDVEGFFLCNAIVNGTGAGSPTSSLWNIRQNGTAVGLEQMGINGGAIRGTSTCVVYMNGTTDYIDLLGAHNGSGAVNFEVRLSVMPVALGAV